MKKIAITLNLLTLGLIAYSAFSVPKEIIGEGELVGTIGGADGPTSLFISNQDLSLVDIALPPLVVTALSFSTVCILRKKTNPHLHPEP
jgi:Na+-transporting methylmalonyl-CoA/oxaloacetate decarboxylase beta subunit